MSNRSILIVEDDADVRAALAAFLEGEGYDVVEAEHGEEALRHLRSSTEFCMILLDLFMPVMNGWDFRSAQQRDPEIASIPVIVISADATTPAKAASLGAVGSMVKPVVLDRLLEMVERYC